MTMSSTLVAPRAMKSSGFPLFKRFSMTRRIHCIPVFTLSRFQASEVSPGETLSARNSLASIPSVVLSAGSEMLFSTCTVMAAGMTLSPLPCTATMLSLVSPGCCATKSNCQLSARALCTGGWAARMLGASILAPSL